MLHVPEFILFSLEKPIWKERGGFLKFSSTPYPHPIISNMITAAPTVCGQIQIIGEKVDKMVQKIWHLMLRR